MLAKRVLSPHEEAIAEGVVVFSGVTSGDHIHICKSRFRNLCEKMHIIWVFPNRDTPKWMVNNNENLFKLDD